MNIGALIYNILSNAPELAALNGNIYPLISHQEVEMPTLVYEVSNFEPIHHRTDEGLHGRASLDFTVFSESYDEAQSITYNLYKALANICGSYGDYNVYLSRFMGQNDSFNAQGLAYGVSSMYDIWLSRRPTIEGPTFDSTEYKFDSTLFTFDTL